MIRIIRNGEVTAMAEPTSPIEVTFTTDPEELAKAGARRARFDRNADWLQAHAHEVYTQHRGKHICIAGQELFVADTAQQALALAKAAHPEDDGHFLRYIPKEKAPRLYAH